MGLCAHGAARKALQETSCSCLFSGSTRQRQAANAVACLNSSGVEKTQLVRVRMGLSNSRLLSTADAYSLLLSKLVPQLYRPTQPRSQGCAWMHEAVCTRHVLDKPALQPSTTAWKCRQHVHGLCMHHARPAAQTSTGQEPLTSQKRQTAGTRLPKPRRNLCFSTYLKAGSKSPRWTGVMAWKR